MKAALCVAALAFPLLAQQQPPATAPATTATPATTAAPATAPATTAAGTTAAGSSVAVTAAPAASGDNWLTGSIDLGYRWQTGIGGSVDTYRSIVNLGSGPKLIGADFTITDPQSRLFDLIQVRAYGWGDEPYETLHIGVRKKKLYEFNADYRDMAYFDFLPSYADPQLSTRGVTLNEQSFDTRRILGSFSLDLLPGNWITPYLAYDRDSGSGTGETTFVSDADEFPVPNTMSDRTNLYRGGVRIGLKRFHVTLEEGGSTFQSNQNLYQAPGRNLGNLTSPFIGQTMDLTSLLATYGIGGSSTYSKGLLTANVTPWLDLYGQFLFSQPKTNVNYRQYDNGNLVLESQLLFYTSQSYLVSAAAMSPHTSGSFGAEVRPFRRVRIVESWMTDRLHDSGSANSNQVLASLGASEQMLALLTSSLATNYSQEEVDLFYDPTSKLVFHGGYRYVWGDANDAILPAAGLVGAEQGKLSRNVGIGGVTFRPTQKLSLTADAEAAVSGGAYFQTSLYNYQKVRAKARYQAAKSLSLFADFTLLDNQNPLSGIKYKYQSQQESLSLLWAPNGGKNWNFQGSYSRSTMNSDIGYLDPEFLIPQQSIYRDDAHTATALFTWNLPRYSGLTPKITAGGALFISSGSRPTSYYRPFAKVFLPVRKNMTWFTEWTYYDYGEVLYVYEGFRTQLVTTGLRFTR
jgi:hypothetical protein